MSETYDSIYEQSLNVARDNREIMVSAGKPVLPKLNLRSQRMNQDSKQGLKPASQRLQLRPKLEGRIVVKNQQAVELLSARGANSEFVTVRSGDDPKERFSINMVELPSTQIYQRVTPRTA